MSTAVTATHLQQLSDLLLAAFDLDELRQLVRTTFDCELEHIVPVRGRTLTAVTGDLTRWAASQPGGLVRLAQAAAIQRPEVAPITELAAEWAGKDFSLRPYQTRGHARTIAIAAGAGALLLVVAVVLYLSMPRPMPGTGYNVAVAEFGSLTASGEVASTDVTHDLSAWFFAAIENELAQLPPSLQHELRGPADVGVIRGATPEERAQQAQQVAERLNATILLYGVIVEENGETRLQPEFYINDKSALAYAGELIGPNRLGSPVGFQTPPDAPGKEAVNRQLDARRQALERTVLGLGYFFIDQFDLAAAQFQSAASLPDWHDADGKEIVYLLVAATHLRQYDPITNPQALKQAQEALQTAYAINPGFARTRLGLGTVSLEHAVRYNAQRTAVAGVDEAALAGARAWFESSIVAPDQSPASFVQIKADYGLAQANSLGAEFHVAGYSTAAARRLYEGVIKAAKATDVAYLRRLVAQAYGGLGRVAGIEGDYAAMAANYQAANAAWNDVAAGHKDQEVARNWAMIGYAEGMQSHACPAVTAYRTAVTLGAKAGAGELEAWKGIISDLEAQGACTNGS